MEDFLFLRIEQIIPTQDAEDYMIGMAEKAQDDINSQTELKYLEANRKEFWTKLIQEMSEKCNLYKNFSPGVYGWIGTRSSIMNFSVSKSYARAELYIDRGRDKKEENEFISNELYKRACRIKAETPGKVSDKDQWNTMLEFMVDSMMRLEQSLKNPLENI